MTTVVMAGHASKGSAIRLRCHQDGNLIAHRQGVIRKRATLVSIETFAGSAWLQATPGWTLTMYDNSNRLYSKI
jgi:hypothetical protein